MTEVSNNEIIEQLRKLRSYQRTLLVDSLYKQYRDDYDKLFKEIDTEIEKTQNKCEDVKSEYDYAKDSFFKSERSELAERYRNLFRVVSTLKKEKENKLHVFEATHDYYVKPKQFDLETERMILAHKCGLSLICDSKLLTSGTE